MEPDVLTIWSRLSCVGNTSNSARETNKYFLVLRGNITNIGILQILSRAAVGWRQVGGDSSVCRHSTGRGGRGPISTQHEVSWTNARAGRGSGDPWQLVLWEPCLVAADNPPSVACWLWCWYTSGTSEKIIQLNYEKNISVGSEERRRVWGQWELISDCQE